jgi:hypothetical protein
MLMQLITYYMMIKNYYKTLAGIGTLFLGTSSLF